MNNNKISKNYTDIIPKRKKSNLKLNAKVSPYCAIPMRYGNYYRKYLQTYRNSYIKSQRGKKKEFIFGMQQTSTYCLNSAQ